MPDPKINAPFTASDIPMKYQIEIIAPRLKKFCLPENLAC
jgi:hypothetical protein